MNTIVILSERLDNGAQRELVQSLSLGLGDNLWVDASGVESLGARCLEALIATWRDQSDHNKQMDLLDPSEVFANHMAFMGAKPDLFVASGGEK